MKPVFAAGALTVFAFAGALAASAAPPAASGAKLFEANCQVCHQAGGVGVPGQFPRLAGRAPVIASSAEGRGFLSQLVLNGMSGVVSVDGQSLVGIMPGFADILSDADAAAVLTYVEDLDAGKGKPARFRAADIAAARKAGAVSPGDMAALRNRLAMGKVIP